MLMYMRLSVSGIAKRTSKAPKSRKNYSIWLFVLGVFTLVTPLEVACPHGAGGASAMQHRRPGERAGQSVRLAGIPEKVA
jgi:hypothetical protein